MEQIKGVMQQLINVSEEELQGFLSKANLKQYKKQAILLSPGAVPNEIFFINKGLIRVFVIDQKGNEHTLHFALENQFITDYANFLRQQAALYTLQTLEDTEVVVLPKTAIDWGYLHLKEGQKMGRSIAEYYFIYQDERINNLFTRTPKQRYDSISEVFPNIHNRVPQHMIASYLGISPVHLSRLKKVSL